jgi:hypothetical protein
MNARPIAIVAAIALGLAAQASAQIVIPMPGTGGTIQLGPQPQQQDRGTYGGSGIRVMGATYGSNCQNHGGNVTQEVARMCEGRNYCVYRVDHRVLGDPRPGCAKDFHARYVCRDGRERWASVRPEASGQSAVLDCRN